MLSSKLAAFPFKCDEIVGPQLELYDIDADLVSQRQKLAISTSEGETGELETFILKNFEVIDSTKELTSANEIVGTILEEIIEWKMA